MRIHLLSVTLLLFLTIGLQSCSGVRTGNLTAGAPQGGYAVLRVRINGNGLSVPNRLGRHYFDAALVKRLDIAGNPIDTIEIDAWEEIYQGETVFLLSLPEGTYRLDSLAIRKSDPKSTLIYRAYSPGDFGTFDILPETVTSLDTVVVEPDFEGVPYRLALARAGSNIDLSFLLETYVNHFYPRAKVGKPIEWNRREAGFDTLRALETIRRNPFQNGHPIVDSKERVLVPTKMGSVKVRMPGGRWFRGESGATTALHSIEETGSGYIISGSGGTVFSTSNLSDTPWDSISGLSPEHDVIYAGKDSKGKVFAISIAQKATLGKPVGSVKKKRPRYTIDQKLVFHRYADPARGSGFWYQVTSMDLSEGRPPGEAFRDENRIIVRMGDEHVRSGDYYVVNLDENRIGPFEDAEWRDYILPLQGSGHLHLNAELGRDAYKAEIMQGDKASKLPFMLHVVAPARGADGKMAAFGRKPKGRVRPLRFQFEELPGATVSKDGKQVPYDPKDGLYFRLSEEEDRWVPFSMPPTDCVHPKNLVIAGNTLVQRCRYGKAFSMHLGDAKWEEEEADNLRLLSDTLTKDGDEQ